MLQTKTFYKNKGIDIRPLDDYSSAFVFQVHPPSIVLIDSYSWLVLELCEEQSFEELKNSHLSVISSSTSPAEVHIRLVETLEMLEQRGLIVFNSSN